MATGLHNGPSARVVRQIARKALRQIICKVTRAPAKRREFETCASGSPVEIKAGSERNYTLKSVKRFSAGSDGPHSTFPLSSAPMGKIQREIALPIRAALSSRRLFSTMPNIAEGNDAGGDETDSSWFRYRLMKHYERRAV
jgi:hypothetical protein